MKPAGSIPANTCRATAWRRSVLIPGADYRLIVRFNGAIWEQRQEWKLPDGKRQRSDWTIVPPPLAEWLTYTK